MLGSMQKETGTMLEQQLNAHISIYRQEAERPNSTSPSKLQSLPPITSFIKVRTYNPPKQLATGDQVLKCLRIMEGMSFKPPQEMY